MGELLRRIAALFRRRSMDRDMQRELQFHLDMKAEDSGGPGAARRSIGSPLAWREKGRDIWGWTHLDEFLRDTRYAARWLVKSPGFTASAIVTLALGIAATTLVFTVADVMVLTPVPFPEPEQLVRLLTIEETPGAPRMVEAGGRVPGGAQPPFTQFLEWGSSNAAFQSLGAMRDAAIDWVQADFPERIAGHRASASLFPMLGMEAALGRTFLPEEELAGKDRVVLLSDRLWRSRFNADPGVIGATIQIRPYDEVVAHTIVGVLPPDMERLYSQFSATGDMWLPLVRGEDGRLQVEALGRLTPGLSPEAAAASLHVPGIRVVAIPYVSMFTGSNGPLAGILAAAVGFVLLIASANVAGLLMARATERTQELTIRAAIGAGRGRLMRQLLAESLVLGACGGIAGTLIAFAAAGSLRAIMPANMLGAEALAVNLRALGFALAVTLLSSLIFGVIPATQGSAAGLQIERLTRQHGARRTWIRATLIGAEIALALILMTGAGLMTQTLYNLVWRDFGFDRRNILTLETSDPLPALLRRGCAHGSRASDSGTPGGTAGGSRSFDLGFPPARRRLHAHRIQEANRRRATPRADRGCVARLPGRYRDSPSSRPLVHGPRRFFRCACCRNQ